MKSDVVNPYADEKKASEEIDRKFGFEIDRVEALIRARSEKPVHATWQHLSPQVFQTPYPELERIILDADPDGSKLSWTDLGCAYGRLGIVLARMRPEARFLGIEVVPERIAEAQRIYLKLGMDPGALVCGDIAADPVPTSEVYFAYDFGHRADIQTVLENLKRRALASPIVVIGRGRGVRDAIEREHPWLGEVNPPLHRSHYSVYFS